MTTETDSEISALHATLERNYGEVISQQTQATLPGKPSSFKETRIASKTHYCDKCGEQIDRTTKYHLTVDKKAGKFTRHREHVTCPADEWANQRHQTSRSVANDQPPTFDARVNERQRENPIPYILLSIAILVGIGLMVVGVLHWTPFG